MIKIDGSEGGGQILRSALSLAMATGQACTMENIRGKRSKPGLMRQHLTCVKAAQEVSNATTEGAELNSQQLVFKPKAISAGDYSFSIGSAGSTTLLFQTLLPALSLADTESTLRVEGGTHNPMAPTADFITRAFLPQAREIGINAVITCPKLGFAPAGGGVIEATVKPHSEWKSINLTSRGDIVKKSCEIIAANLPPKVVKDELKSLENSLSPEEWQYEVRYENEVDGGGNLISLELEYPDHVLHVTSHGKFGKPSSRVVSDAIKSLKTFEKSKAAIGVRLADQLLLPMALAKGGQLKVNTLTNHISTNIKTIEQFLDVQFNVETVSPGEILVSL